MVIFGIINKNRSVMLVVKLSDEYTLVRSAFVIISKNLFNFDLRSITRTDHKSFPLNKRFVFFTYKIHRTSYVPRRYISFITLLSLSHDIYLFSTTHIHTYKVKESLISSAQQPLSLMMTGSSFSSPPSSFSLRLFYS
jgi:hypothetical protein